MLKKLLATAILLSGATCWADTKNDIEALKNASSESQLAYEVVASLTREVGPRIAGSEGDKKAVLWAEDKLRSLGFDKVYKQPVRVRNWSRGLADANIIKPFEHKLVVTALGGSVATPEAGITAKVIMVDSLEDLKTRSVDEIKGNIVFINKRMERDRAGKGYGPVVIGRSRGAIEAAMLEAQAVIIRSVGTDQSRFAHTGAMQYSPDVEKIPAGALSNADADTLEYMFSQEAPVKMHLNVQAKEHGWQTSYNVIGEITGTEKPEEIVLIGAHLDSWDEGTGALDDGAGVGIVTAAATLIKETLGATKRTIRVVLYANEEFGLIGAKEYAKANEQELGQIIVAAESDFGAGQIYQLDTRFAPAALPFVKELMQHLAPLGIEEGTNTATGGPDISMLPAKGVPVVSLRQDGTHYFDYHHTPNDTLDKIAPEDIQQNQTAYAIFTYLMANSDVDPRPAPALLK
ncbi:M20/M25/M40 family metallo-hydrolase [Planctobacterium marinum]|uniref:M20/M25/M40 family metallo-hydrolase n=1 Tax=Planctobacterium marinum TaxID=1631968 RepID=UPI001E50EF01|nr:M20/M25/M40 family metallo-hydrolase [Planctobacterium marinum]MCC2605457.1 M20/M25/M40 family metallo-hydrolase [Planctobacterium marinum]